jgi:hypothetical protein
MWCEVSRAQLNPSVKYPSPPERRTLERIRLLAHTAVGICPGCKMEIVATQAEVTDESKQMAMAAVGAAEPSQGKWSEYLRSCEMTWLEGHFGIVYGRYPLLHIEPDKWYLCLLHFNLRVTGGTINKCAFEHIGKYGDAKEQATAICAVLEEAGIWVREERLQPKSKNQNAAYVKDISFVGRDAVGIQTLAEKLMDIVIHVDEREDDEDVMNVYNKAMAVWDAWRELWRLLNNRVDSDNAEARNTRADEVQVLADRYRVAWVRAVGSTAGLYVHIMHEHLADQVRAVGDLRPYQSQGLEHLHSFRKLIARHLTNRQIALSKHKRNRVTQSFSVQLAGKELMRRQAKSEDQKDHKRRALANAKTREKRVAEVAATGRVKEV